MQKAKLGSSAAILAVRKGTKMPIVRKKKERQAKTKKMEK